MFNIMLLKLSNSKNEGDSCTKNRDLLFNWWIIMAPMSIVDYVVVHELCHLNEPNHTKTFWRMVKAIIADFHERKEWLKIHDPTLVL
ncbi:MAG: DUF45 domain-containing protein [Candidatus Heimdallarchaeota archaeon]|nr:DUF45 domain-containing protein [Candidatus Heimdallarchaeota archaeon]